MPKIRKKVTLIILDSARIHHHPYWQSLVEGYGIKVVFLPAYSPHLNPVEWAWQALKQLLKKTNDPEEDNALINIKFFMDYLKEFDLKNVAIEAGY